MRMSFLAAAALILLSCSSVLAEEEPWGDHPGPPEVVDVGLDPGHSDFDVGAAGSGLRECDLTLAVALEVKALLEASGLSVAMSRQDNRPLTDFSEQDPTERIRLEQEARIVAVGSTRVFVSLHFNGYDDPRVRGAETYFNGDNQGEESRRLAEAIQSGLVSEVRTTGYLVPDRGVKEDLAAGKPYGHFFSLRGPAPSVLVECLFLTNPHEDALLSQEETRTAIARGIADGIAEYLMGGGDFTTP